MEHGKGLIILCLMKSHLFSFLNDLNVKVVATGAFSAFKAGVGSYFRGAISPRTPPGENLGWLSSWFLKYEVDGQKKTR